MELEQARKRAEELRVIIEKTTAYTTTRTPRAGGFRVRRFEPRAQADRSRIPRAGHGQLTHRSM